MARGYSGSLKGELPAVQLSDEAFSRALDSARRHQHHGFATIYAGMNRATYATANAEGAPDPRQVTNTVFLQAFENIDRFAGDRPAFCVFLVSLARFAISDDRHRRNRQVDSFEEAEVGNSTDGELAPAEAARQAMGDLSSAQRTVLALRIFFGLTGPEVAAALELPIIEVRTIQARAEVRLQGVPIA